MNSTQLGKKRTSPSTQRRNARRREEFLRKKLNFSSVSSSALDSPADISPSATTTETTPVTAADATPTLAPETAPLPSPSEQKAKSDQVQEEFLLEGVEVSPPKRSYSHITVEPEPPLIQFGPHNGLRPHWGRHTREA